jgi:hypothetical protein
MKKSAIIGKLAKSAFRAKIAAWHVESGNCRRDDSDIRHRAASGIGGGGGVAKQAFRRGGGKLMAAWRASKNGRAKLWRMAGGSLAKWLKIVAYQRGENVALSIMAASKRRRKRRHGRHRAISAAKYRRRR